MIGKSGLLGNQGHDGLLAIHPCSGGGASPGNHVMDALIVVGQISRKDGLGVTTRK
jgi:hypothetical protein